MVAWTKGIALEIRFWTHCKSTAGGVKRGSKESRIVPSFSGMGRALGIIKLQFTEIFTFVKSFILSLYAGLLP